MTRLLLSYTHYRVLGGVMMLLLGSAWAHAQDATTPLRTRIEAYWQAQEHEDWHTLFRLLSPNYLHGVSEDDFVQAKNRLEKLRFSHTGVYRIEQQGEYAWAEVEYAYRPRQYEQLPARQAHIWDVWKLEQGQYYPVPSEWRQAVPGLPPVARATREEQTLTARLHQFWKAREQHDQATLYELLDPAYRRRVDFATFRKSRPFYQYLIHTLDWVEVPLDERKGRARITFTYKLNDPSLSKMPPREESLMQEWIKVDEQWYRSIPTEPETSVSNPERQGDKGA